MAAHGTITRYSNPPFCRCWACREANRMHYREKRRRWRAAGLCGHCGVRRSGRRYKCGRCADYVVAHEAWQRRGPLSGATREG